MAKGKKTKIPKPGDPEYRIVKAHKENFKNLERAFESGQVCLMDCVLKATGEHVAVITILQPAMDEPGMIDSIPMAMFFNSNPYDLLISPIEQKEAKKNGNDRN